MNRRLSAGFASPGATQYTGPLNAPLAAERHEGTKA